ncbi:MAG: FAD-dependent thymidylate synthase, partial [Patescibacteria group bacterium]|nr:FAD-dependent thymidylate synthase [Patescibacteria group bacterium]
MNSMIDVKLIAHTNVDPLDLASHAARTCYTAEPPEIGKRIDVENMLFKTGHHTTLQHFYFTFQINGIAIGDVKFGVHLVSPFYNSDERSGRYAAKMFTDPDINQIKRYILELWPEIQVNIDQVIAFVTNGIEIYKQYISAAADIATKFIKEERPFVHEEFISNNAKKFAQEQLRNFISLIFPTGEDITMNLVAITALYESAWSPALRLITQKMAQLITAKFPELQFMFDQSKQRKNDWEIIIPESKMAGIKFKPSWKLIEMRNLEDFIQPSYEMQHPTDKLHFTPELMINNIGEIRAEVEVSSATFGQDQRHRTIRRTMPQFTGNFYVPPIIKELGLEKLAQKYMKSWLELAPKLPRTLAMDIAPYGAMVCYQKAGSINAISHEQ